jgi:hypothetical protein
MPFTLQDANLHSPEAVMNRIVRQIDQMDDEGRLITNDIFPMVELSDSQEKHFTHVGIRPGMRQTSLASESPVGDIEGLGERDVTVETFKKKIQPEKGVDTELNSQMEILNLFNAVSDALMEDILLTRAEIAWRGLGPIDGLIGQNGDDTHPEIDASHVATPGTAYSDTANSKPITDMIDAEFRINEDGSALGRAGQMTAFLTPSILRDLKLNDDIQSEYDGVRALSETQLTDAFQLDQIRVVRTQVVRRNANGEPIDDAGNTVDSLENAARDNVLEPYDPGAATQRRNIVIGAPGQVSAFMPWFMDRLAERGDAAPDGDVSVDATNGWMTQTWTENDPLATWFKAAQEIGFHVTRGDNWYIIQDI